MTPHEVEEILTEDIDLSRIPLKDAHFRVVSHPTKTGIGADFWVQLIFWDDKEGIQHCRKWRMSKHMTVTEVVRTAFKAVEAAIHHELCEFFKYRGAAIYGPHIDVDELVMVAELLDRRE